LGGSYYKNGRWKDKKYVLNGILNNTGPVGKTKNKMRGRRSEGHVTNPRNRRMEEMSRRQRRMEASSEGGQSPEGAVAPWMDGWKN
jgi:hypothetical protein